MKFDKSLNYNSRVLWLVAMRLGMQLVLRLIPASGTFFHEGLVMKIFLMTILLFC